MDDTENHQSPPEPADEPTPEAEPIPEGYAPNPEPSPEPDKPKQENTLDRDMVRWTRVVGVFTVVLAFVGAIQSWAFIQSERADVYLEIDNTEPFPLIADTPLYFKMVLFNNGRSQAFVSELHINGMIIKDELPKVPVYSNGFSRSAVIPSHGKRTLLAGPISANLIGAKWVTSIAAP